MHKELDFAAVAVDFKAQLQQPAPNKAAQNLADGSK
jgi:hypothetical protein